MAMEKALQILKSNFGYDEFRPMQREIIEAVTSGSDALVLMPTGGGKSLCYQIPALMMEGTAVVVSPLISLMKDQVEALRANGIEAATLNSGISADEERQIRQRLRCGQLQLLYISPERLMLELDWLAESLRVSLFAIDEAHCISQWGHDFRPEYTQLGVIHERFPDVPVIALTATADKLTKTDIVDKLRLHQPQIFVSFFDRPNLSLDVKRGLSAAEKLRTIMQVIGRHPRESGIIYCLSRRITEKLAEKLRAKGVSVGVYHAGLPIVERNRVQEDFINDRIDVVVATIAFGMGIDKSNVRYVIHYNLPKSIESFYQEIGRGGRDGLPSETLLFFNVADIIALRSFADTSGQREIAHEKLNRMQEYAEAQVCRRRILLNYFGEESDCRCGNCDVCHNPPVYFGGTVLVQKALSAIMRADQQIGLTLTAEILRGTMSPEVVARGYHRLKTFGAGRDIAFRDWQDYLLQMLHMGFIEIAYDDDRHLRVTSLGREVLFGHRRAQLAAVVRETAEVKKTKERRKGVTAESALADGKHEDRILYERLRELRQEIAQAHNWPAYIVMSDKSLHAMAIEKPTTIEAFGSIFGIGEHKRDAYGERFTSFISEYLVATENVKPQPVMSYIDRQKQLHPNAYAAWTNDDDNQLQELHAKGTPIERLMAIFSRNKGSIISRLRKLGKKE